MFRSSSRKTNSTYHWKFPILGYVRDAANDLWGIRDRRATRHGFDLLFGSPISRLTDYCGQPCLIDTKELAAFWESNKTKHDAVKYDLPAGRSTLKRARRRLGFNYLRDLDNYWQERIHDLRTLSTREIAARTNLDIHVVSDARFRVLGRRARDLNWWRTPETLAILRSNVTLREIGEKLGIGTSHAKRLKDRARALSATETQGGSRCPEPLPDPILTLVP